MKKVIKMLLVVTMALFFANCAWAGAKKIVINLPGRSLALYDGENKVRLYPIAIGKPSTPTPVGYYKISSKDKNPTWTDPSNPANSIPSGPSNPLGYRWMQLYGNYGIHGTNNPKSVGNYVSNGCIRMFEENVEELFELVEIGTPVEINYNRVVVEKTPEGVVAFYVYPDNYNRQNLTVDMIKNWLKGYGVEDFVSDADILAKINASDGSPTFIAKSNTIILNGEKLKEKAVQADGIMYLPLNIISDKLSEKYNWNKDSLTISTSFAEAKGIVKGSKIYLDARDLDDLFRVKGELNKDNAFVIGDYVKAGESKPQNTNTEIKEEPKKTNQEPAVSSDIKENDNNKAVSDNNDKAQDSGIVPQKEETKKEETKKDIRKKGKPVIIIKPQTTKEKSA